MGKAARPNMSTMSAEGGGRLVDRMEDRKKGMESIMVNIIRAAKGGLGGSVGEPSMGGTRTMLRLDGCWRMWEVVVAVSVVTMKMVTWKEWWVRRRLPSSSMGMRCPMPGLATSAAWAFDVTIIIPTCFLFSLFLQNTNTDSYRD